MTALKRSRRMCLALCAALAAGWSAQAFAQTNAAGVPNALQGFSKNRDKPIKIDAATLEVRDKDKVATFLGNVNLTQGDTTLKCKTLVVFYDQNSPGAKMMAAEPGPGGSQQIRRLEAKGDVVVTQKDQIATGDSGVFDIKTNTVTLMGKVVITQGQNVLRGDKLVVDLTTGVSRVESERNGRVEGLFLPGSAKDVRAGPAPGKEAPRASSPGPSRTN